LLEAPQARDTVVRILGEVRAECRFRLLGYVVMPEHIHLLMSEPSQGTPSTVMQVFKQDSSRAVREGRGEMYGPLWTTRFHDFNVFTEGKKNEKLHYMHMNPVKRNLVKPPHQWPWSSYNFYWKKGVVLLAMDPE
jgi:putative transposase